MIGRVTPDPSRLASLRLPPQSPSARRAVPLTRVLMMKCGCVTSRPRPVYMCRTLTPPPPVLPREREAEALELEGVA